MILYLDARTNYDSISIDSIIIQDKSGKDHELTWDEMDAGTVENGYTDITPLQFNSRHKGVYIDGEYGNTKLIDLVPVRIKEIIFDEMDECPDNFLFCLFKMTLKDGDDEYVVETPEEESDEPVYVEGEIPPTIGLYIDGKTHFGDDDKFCFKSITIMDVNGNEHKITWDGFVKETIPYTVDGLSTIALSVQLQGIHVDGEDMFYDTLEDIVPFFIKDVEYIYKGTNPDDVWFTIHMMDIRNGNANYRVESTEPIYSTWWKTPE